MGHLGLVYVQRRTPMMIKIGVIFLVAIFFWIVVIVLVFHSIKFMQQLSL